MSSDWSRQDLSLGFLCPQRGSRHPGCSRKSCWLKKGCDWLLGSFLFGTEIGGFHPSRAVGGHKIIPKVYPVPSHILIFQLFKHRLNGNTSKGNNVKSRGSFKDPAQAEGKYLFQSISLIWPNLIQVTLKKRGWGRLAELGETYYENLVEDDNVGKLLVQNV